MARDTKIVAGAAYKVPGDRYDETRLCVATQGVGNTKGLFWSVSEGLHEISGGASMDRLEMVEEGDVSLLASRLRDLESARAQDVRALVKLSRQVAQLERKISALESGG